MRKGNADMGRILSPRRAAAPTLPARSLQSQRKKSVQKFDWVDVLHEIEKAMAKRIASGTGNCGKAIRRRRPPCA